jgi:hypothetical protein
VRQRQRTAAHKGTGGETDEVGESEVERALKAVIAADVGLSCALSQSMLLACVDPSLKAGADLRVRGVESGQCVDAGAISGHEQREERVQAGCVAAVRWSSVQVSVETVEREWVSRTFVECMRRGSEQKGQKTKGRNEEGEGREVRCC